jgi:hypothetical protein
MASPGLLSTGEAADLLALRPRRQFRLIAGLLGFEPWAGHWETSSVMAVAAQLVAYGTPAEQEAARRALERPSG